MQSAALVSTQGCIDWCCLPRFDSPSLFAALLDDEKGGYFHIRPAGGFTSDQHYVTDTNVLQTRFRTDEGEGTLTDFMPCYQTTGGRPAAHLQIIRRMSCKRGQVSMNAIFKPAPEYAEAEMWLSAGRHGVAGTSPGARVTLSAEVPFHIADGKATSSFVIRTGEVADFILSWDKADVRPPGLFRAGEKLARTQHYWGQKAAGCSFDGPWRDALVRSYLVLHLLIYAPTGALVAAPTTSLPEEIGGVRNWDYRYAWLRDASLTLDSFYRLGHLEEAARFMQWLIEVCRERGPGGQPVFSTDLANPLDERCLDHLSGYRGSRPVRAGNDAYRQRQLDVFGEILEGAHSYLDMGGYISRSMWALLQDYVDAASRLWSEPDSGVWEVRSAPKHFVYSKLMCWVALDRGIRVAEKLGYSKNRTPSWRRAREQVKDELLTRGWREGRQSFVQHYDTDALDATGLLLCLYEVLPPSDPRIRSTVDRIAAELLDHGLLRRYRTDESDDGIAGTEGAFLWCSFWLVRALLRLGRRPEARKLYEELLGVSNHLGLYSEMADPASRQLLGNFPQALTHLAAIMTGLELTRAGVAGNGGET